MERGSQSYTQEDSLYAGGLLSQVTIKHKKSTNKYLQTLNRVKRVYPYVLEADRLLKEFNKTTKDLKRKTQIRKFGRKQKRKLKNEFMYGFKDMSRKDGVVMMKLIHRKTNMTTYDIIKQYRGKANANLMHSLGKLFDQNFKVKFEPKEDKVLGRVYSDIVMKRIHVPTKIKKLTKKEYKAKKKKNKERKKANLLLMQQIKENKEVANHKKSSGKTPELFIKMCFFYLAVLAN